MNKLHKSFVHFTNWKWWCCQFLYDNFYFSIFKLTTVLITFDIYLKYAQASKYYFRLIRGNNFKFVFKHIADSFFCFDRLNDECRQRICNCGCVYFGTNFTLTHSMTKSFPNKALKINFIWLIMKFIWQIFTNLIKCCIFIGKYLINSDLSQAVKIYLSICQQIIEYWIIEK